MPDEMFSGMQERRQEIIDELRDVMADGEIDETNGRTSCRWYPQQNGIS